MQNCNFFDDSDNENNSKPIQQSNKLINPNANFFDDEEDEYTDRIQINNNPLDDKYYERLDLAKKDTVPANWNHHNDWQESESTNIVKSNNQNKNMTNNRNHTKKPINPNANFFDDDEDEKTDIVKK